MLIKYNNKTEMVNNLEDCYRLSEANDNIELIEAVVEIVESNKILSWESEIEDLEDKLDDKTYDLKNAFDELEKLRMFITWEDDDNIVATLDKTIDDLDRIISEIKENIEG